MFKIIGADGRQYGPVSAEQLRQWIAQGRANAQTLIQAEGSTEWKRLGEFPEFSPSSTPAPTPTAPMPAASAPGPVSASTVQPKTNSMAIAGLVMGIAGMTIGLLCCGFLFDILGIIFSSIGFSQINRDPARQTGKSIALWGLALSILGLLFSIGIGMLFAMRSMLGRHLYSWHYHW